MRRRSLDNASTKKQPPDEATKTRNRMKQKLQHIFLIIICALAWSTGAWAWGESTSYVAERASEEIMWTNNEGATITLSGPGATIFFQAKKQTAAAGGLYVQVSTDGSNWTTPDGFDIASSLKTSYNDFEKNISTDIKYIRFKAHGTLRKYVRNVKVTRATTLSTSTTSLSFGNVTKGSNKTLNASIDYNNTTYNQQVTGSCTNGMFSVTSTTVGATGNGQAIPVIFKSTAVGAQSGTVTLTMNGKTVTFNVSGTGVTTYYTQAQAYASTGGTVYASWTNDSFSAASTSVKNSGTVSTTSASATAYYKAEAASGYVFKGWTWPNDNYTAGYVSTNTTDQYTYDYNSESSGSPTIAAFKAWFAPVFNFGATASSSNNSYGTATASVTSSIEGNPEQASASTTATFTATPAAGCTFNGWYESADFSGSPVSMDATYAVTLTNSTPGSTLSKTLYAKFKKNPALQWTVADLDLNIISGATANSAAHGADGGLSITYTSSNTDALTIDADGTVHALGLGTSVVTASVAEDNNYNADAISRTFTVGEKKQATFTPSWGEGTTTDIKVGATATIALTNAATDETFTVSATPTGIISWTREGNTLTISGDVAGTATLTLSQVGSASLNGNTANYSITVSKYANSLAVAAEDKAMKVGDEWTNVVTNTGNDNTEVSYSTSGIATYDAANNKIIAQAEGSTTITFTQAATASHEGKTLNIAVTVTKIANTLTISLPSQAAEVDGTIALSIKGQNNSADIVATITDTELSSAVNNGSDVITYANGVITARNAGTAKITFSQPATGQYTAYTSETYEITVTKRSNAITLTLNGGSSTNIKLKYGATATLAYTRTNMDTTPTVTRTSGSYTTLSGSTITAGNAAGTDIYEVSQAETYKYEAVYAQFSIRVNNTDEAVGYVLYEDKEYSHGTGAGVAHTYQLSGPGETVYYKACRGSAVTIYYNLYVEWSADNQNWTECHNNTSLDPDYKDEFFTCPVPENARYIRFRFPGGGTLVKYIKDVHVTRKTYVRASSDKTALGETYTDQTKTATFTVNYSSANGGNINIQSSNPHFVPSMSSISVPTNKTAVDNSTGNNTSYICGVDGTQTFTVTYTPDPDQLRAEEAVITIGDLFYQQQITLTASAKKYDTSIARGSNTATETTVDGTIANAFAFSGTTTATPSANAADDFYYAISHTQTTSVNKGEGVISYDPATNTITGLNAGTARLTIYQKKTNLYHATSQTYDFTVTKFANNLGIALSATELNVDGTTTVELTNNESQTALTASYSSVEYTNEAQNREGGLLSFDAETNTLTGTNAGSATVTITQPETYKYEAASAQFVVTVSKLAQTLAWDNPELDTEMQKGSTLAGNTATSSAGLTPVTYSSSNIAAITVDANTGLLTAVETGANVTITASQAGNYKYLPATLTRLFSVFNKQVPVFTPDAHFAGANGRVEYTCTATISVAGVSEDVDFSITNGDNSIISVVKDGTTITITGLQIGSTTLTLTQAGNEDFIAKSQTYNIEVYWPEDFLTLSPSDAPSHAEGDYRKIFMQRTLRAGYSTITLPFDTDVETLVGGRDEAYDSSNDWVAQLTTVTNSEADGYTLYFTRVAVGAIEANQPYVLHLGAEVENPTWTDMEGGISVVEAEATSVAPTTGYSGYAGWHMWSNYEAGFDMEGKYGIVNSEGGLKLGGSGSTLKAYTAYIAAPQQNGAPRVRVAYVDEDGKTTYVNSLPGEADCEAAVIEAIYGPDGKPRSRMQRGMNIVRYADGTSRKVMF